VIGWERHTVPSNFVERSKDSFTLEFTKRAQDLSWKEGGQILIKEEDDKLILRKVEE